MVTSKNRGGKRVLEMSNLGTKDDLSLEEMNG